MSKLSVSGDYQHSKLRFKTNFTFSRKDKLLTFKDFVLKDLITYNKQLETTDTYEPPHVPQELIEYLERVMPSRDPQPGEKIEEIMHYSGKRAVIQFLKEL